MRLDPLDVDHDLLVVMPHPKWSYHAVVSFPYCVGHSLLENEIKVIELLSAVYASGYFLVGDKLLKGVVWLPGSHSIQKDLGLWVNIVSDILFTHFLGEELDILA